MLLTGAVWNSSGEAAPFPVPKEVRSQWTFDAEQVSLRWDAERRTLIFRQRVVQTVIRGPGDLYRLPYRVVFEADREESKALLVLGKDGSPTHLTGSVLEQNKAANPQVLLVNPAGMTVGPWLDPSL